MSGKSRTPSAGTPVPDCQEGLAWPAVQEEKVPSAASVPVAQLLAPPLPPTIDPGSGLSNRLRPKARFQGCSAMRLSKDSDGSGGVLGFFQKVASSASCCAWVPA